MAFNFTEKRYLVTGATRGVGRDLAKALVKAGAEVYAVGRDEGLLLSLENECSGKVRAVRLDLSDWEATRRALEVLPIMDGLVNNAGIVSPRLSSLEVTKDEVDKVFAANLHAALNVIQVVGKKMVAEGKGGSIVNVSSINGLQSMDGCLSYNMSKAAMDMMTKQFALELGPNNIRVNSVNPTVMLTAMTRPYWGDISSGSPGAKLIAHTPLGRYGTVSECVNVIMYLLSDLSSMVTGTTNPIDGGLLSNISV